MLTGLLLFNTLAALLLSAVLLRAKRCWENQMLALALSLDAAAAGHLSWLVMTGESIASPEALYGMLLSKVLVVYPLLEFAYAFPFGRRPPRLVRVLGLGATALELVLVLHPRTAAVADSWLGRLLYFLPFAAATLTVMLRNLRELGARAADREMRGARAVLAAISYRWVTEFVLFVVIRPVWPDLFPVALMNHGTISVLGSYVVIAHAVLVYHCLRVGDLIARTTLHSLLLFASIAFVIAVEAFLAGRGAGPVVRAVALGGLVLFFWTAWAGARHWGPKLESVVLGPLDPRRLERNTVLEQTLQKLAKLTSAKEITTLTTAAIAQLNGGEVRFHGAAGSADERAPRSGPTADLPAPLEHALRDPEVPLLTREQSLRLPPAACDAFGALDADVVLPVRAEGKLLGALCLHHLPKLAPEMLETSKLLADNLGSKLLHHALYERAYELQTQLEQSRHLATLGSFVAAIAHDIRTPLTSVKMNLEMLRDRIGDDVDSRECAALALEELARMNNYVSGMLDFVKPVQLTATDIALSDLIDDTARLMQPVLESRKLRLIRAVPPSAADSVVTGDLLRLRQILANLLANAADASPPGAEVRIAVRGGAGRISISVTDLGDGIAGADLERIFDPFFTTRVEGTGLGLAIVRKLVEAHAGTIEVESTLGAGSTFTLTLPTRASAEEIAPGSREVAGAPYAPAPSTEAKALTGETMAGSPQSRATESRPA